jgi:hypothetical protein
MMHVLLAMAMTWRINDMWYALPLIVAVSLVYSATRHEQLRPILHHALRVGIWIGGFMFVFFLICMLIIQFVLH